MSEVSDLFWAEDPSILFRSDRFLEFFITADQTANEKLNALVRFGIYTAVILSLYNNKPRYLVLSVLGMLVTYFIYINTDKKDRFQELRQKAFDNIAQNPTKNKDDDKIFTKPTLNNPFMNPSIMDIIDHPDKPQGFYYASKTKESDNIKKDIQDKYTYNLYRDVGDVYNKDNQSRQFYTVPSTTFPSDKNGDFKQWLYGTMNTTSCKDNTYFCYKNLYEPLQAKSRANPTLS